MEGYVTVGRGMLSLGTLAVLLAGCGQTIPTTCPSPAASTIAVFPASSPTPTAMATASPTASPTATAQPLSAQEIVRGNPARAQVALTFDIGLDPDVALQVLEELRKEGVWATFFVAGNWLEKRPEVLQQIAADGHELGNHSYSHRDFTQLTDEQIVEELGRTETLVKRLTGRSTKPYFRPPFGARDGRTLEVAAKAGYRSVYWTLDSGDWLAGATADKVAKRVLDNVGNGYIVVLHASSRPTAQALPRLLAGLKAKGFKVVTVSQVLAP